MKTAMSIAGRMMMKISSPELVEILLQISKDIEVVPAHIWTPYFGCLGSKTGFDSIKDCYLDQIKHIHAIETGLSCYDEKTEVLTEDGWKILNNRWMYFFFTLALLNEIVWRTQSEEFWVNFKVWGLLPITFIFTAFQVGLINKYKTNE